MDDLSPPRAEPPFGRQFVAIKFREADQRSYTYHNDGPPVSIGDRVLVPSRNGGSQAVIVAGLGIDPPPFETKAILGLEPADELDLKGENDHAE
jgi:hypothetical protein